MEITLKKKEEVEDLPESEEVSKTPSLEEEKRRLEIENAEMRGRLSVQKETVKSSSVNSHEQTKQRVYADMALDDEKFQEIYKMDKASARAAILERDNEITRKESLRYRAEAEAKVEMATKYGANFYQYKNHIDEAVEDLSDEAKSDPKRLARAMERIYLSLQKEGVVKPVDKERKKIVSDFEKPGTSEKIEKQPENDDVDEKYRPMTKIFGITSEKERKELMKTIENGAFVPMNMGGGYVFKDPARGFEKVEQKV